MTTQAIIYALFGGTVGVLSAATLARILVQRLWGRSDSLDNFNSRTRAWWVMVAIMTLARVTGKNGTAIRYALASAVAVCRVKRHQ